ncbi:MAG: MucB/RseB C-terminal domain-containing protein [Pseudomonadota bacterium]
MNVFMGMKSVSRWLRWSCAFGLIPWGVLAAPALDANDTRAWLSRIHQAASQNNFQGTFVVSGGGSVSSARISHFCEGSHQYEHIESLDGQARHVFRHNSAVHTVWPQTKVAQVERREFDGTFPALLQVADARFADFYEVKRQSGDRVAGHETDVLVLQPRDAYRFGYRLWAEKNSGLLLRADVLGERNEVLETSVFSEVRIGIKAQADSVLRPMKRLDGYRVIRPSMVTTKLESEGWTLKQAVPGFQPVSCVKRPLEVQADTPMTEVVQAIFSDGLTYVSVFIEPFQAARHAQPMQTSLGATQTLTRRQGEAWITVVGDVPSATLRAFSEGLDRVKR